MNALELEPPARPPTDGRCDVLPFSTQPLGAAEGCPLYFQRWDGRERIWRWLGPVGLDLTEASRISAYDVALLESHGGRVGWYRWLWVNMWTLHSTRLAMPVWRASNINLGKSTPPTWCGARA